MECAQLVTSIRDWFEPGFSGPESALAYVSQRQCRRLFASTDFMKRVSSFDRQFDQCVDVVAEHRENQHLMSKFPEVGDELAANDWSPFGLDREGIPTDALAVTMQSGVFPGRWWVPMVAG